MSLRLIEIKPTVLLTGPEGDLRQVVQVTVAHSGAACEARLRIVLQGQVTEVPLPLGTGTESQHEVLIPEPTQAGEAVVSLIAGGEVVDTRTVPWTPPPHLRVHLIQRSHHDVGYTNVPSAVLREHCEFLDQALDLAAATADYPDDARFRMVIEQAWSLQEFARRAPVDRLARMGELLRRGDFELTALFGNMTTELCGHEESVRALYPSRALARQFGCEIISAEHNDVPGMSWGVAQVLSEAGIRLFCPGLPRYWSWGNPPRQSFWDDATLFPQGQPGAFWWEAPSGKRVLLWDALGCGGEVRPDLPDLAERLRALVEKGYPYATVYWPVRGGARDNSPYVRGFADTARAWNERFTYPRLLTSTNARFYADLQSELPADLPVFRGDLPGQDYPVGAASTAIATGVNRVNHTRLPAAETLATLASAVTDHAYPGRDLAQAWEDTLWHDEHTWGHHFPAGPAAQASQVEKALHAHRAAALGHDVAARALARIADHVQFPHDGFFLVACNPLPWVRTALVTAPLRELENCGSVMMAVTDPADPEAPAYLRGVALTDRWHKHPAPELVAGRFDLVDLASGETVEFELVDVVDGEDTVPDAPERFGLAQGGKRYGFFETPSGLGRDLRFVATDLPPCGYRTYELRPQPEKKPEPSSAAPRPVIENEYYRLEADPDSGRIVSLIDRKADRELLDGTAPHGLGELVVRSPDGLLTTEFGGVSTRRAALSQRLQLESSAPGHPHIRVTVELHEGSPQANLAVRVLKSPTPLLEAWLAFPFSLPSPQFRYEGVLSAVTPLVDFLPGAYWDAIAVQNWLRISGGDRSLLWSSREAPIVSLGGLQPGYVSPAHSCRIPQRGDHAPAGPEQLRQSWLYSLLFANNFGTNFAVSQTGSGLFRYSYGMVPGVPSDTEAARWGVEQATAPETIFATKRRDGHLPLSTGLLRMERDPLALLACKRAEVGEGFILRLWNPAETVAETTLLPAFAGAFDARLVGVTEDDGPSEGAHVTQDGKGLRVRLAARAVVTVRLTGN